MSQLDFVSVDDVMKSDVTNQRRFASTCGPRVTHLKQTPVRAKPFLKWPGGKRWIAPLIVHSVSDYLGSTYVEPFLGAGAVFFYMRPEKAILSDTNPDVITCTKAVKADAKAIKRVLSRWPNEEESYLRIRKRVPRKEHLAAARIIYLTHTCWGGMYRVNKRGEFNVPFGRSGRAVCDPDNLLVCKDALQHADIQSSDFEPVIDQAGDGDLVYADPPYTTLGQNNGFVRYNERLFAWEDQRRLASACRRASNRGACVVVSGLWHVSLLALYKGWWATSVSRFSTVSASLKGRRKVEEALLFSRPPNLVDMCVWRAGSGLRTVRV